MVLASEGKLARLVLSASLLCVLALLFFANRLLVNEVPVTQNPDEIIPIRTIQHMAQTHTLDTDWAHADLPENFRNVHFNFSGYIMASRAYVGMTSPRAIPHDDQLLDKLRKVSRIATLCMVLLVFVAVRPWWGDAYALLASIAVLLVPLTFQDAHYARPEALSTLIFTSCFLLAAQRTGSVWRDYLRTTAILGMCGFLASIKVTYVLALVFALPVMQPHLKAAHTLADRGARLARFGLAGLLAFLAGLIVGAPYAIMHPSVYLEGLHALEMQYGGLHPPHSLMTYSFPGQISWIFYYFASTIGTAALILHPLGYCSENPRPAMFAFGAIAAATLLLFACQHVFFERNLSHLAPCFMILSVGGIRELVRRLSISVVVPLRAGSAVAMAIVLFLLLLRTSYGMTFELRHVFTVEDARAEQVALDNHVKRVVQKIGATRVVDIGYGQVFAGEMPIAEECTLYKVTTYGDDWSRQFMQSLPESIKIDHVQWSRFSNVPTSTLHTYHSPTVYLMHDPSSCQQQDPA